jgi:hypothetical protein
MLRVQVEPSGEDAWKLEPVVELINRGAVGIIPTDTVYAHRFQSHRVFVWLLCLSRSLPLSSLVRWRSATLQNCG